MSEQTDNEFKNEHDVLVKVFFGVKQAMLNYLNNFTAGTFKAYKLRGICLDETSYFLSNGKYGSL